MATTVAATPSVVEHRGGGDRLGQDRPVATSVTPGAAVARERLDEPVTALQHLLRGARRRRAVARAARNGRLIDRAGRQAQVATRAARPGHLVHGIAEHPVGLQGEGRLEATTPGSSSPTEGVIVDW